MIPRIPLCRADVETHCQPDSYRCRRVRLRKPDPRFRYAIVDPVRSSVEGGHGACKGQSSQALLVAVVVAEIPQGNARRIENANEINVDGLEIRLDWLVLLDAELLLETLVEAANLADTGVRQDNVDSTEALLAQSKESELRVP